MTRETPLLSVIVPTVGRPSLARTVRSLLKQGDWLPWEAILVGDTHAPSGGPGTWAQQLPTARALAATDPRLSYVEHDGGIHMVGHPQRNHGYGSKEQGSARGESRHGMNPRLGTISDRYHRRIRAPWLAVIR